MELFRNTNIDFLGKKWYFLAFSLIFSVAGIWSMLFWHHIPWGVEFRGGTLVYVKFAQRPDPEQLRHQLDRAGLHDPKIQPFGPASDNEVLVDLGLEETSEAALDQGFAHAWTTILDTHVTTIVSAVILFLFGTGPVKGFAVTLSFGLLANLFTAVFVSRVIFEAVLNRHTRGEALSI